MADLYEVLGVPRNASPDDIKRAYRKKARSSHPDAGGDEEEFKRLTHAYEVLSDAERRRRYDRFGDDGTPQSRGAGDPFGFGGGQGFGGLGDVIDAFFGSAFGGPQQGGRQRAANGRDVLVGVELTLEDVATGVTRDVDVEVADTCDVCEGSGSSSGTGPTACSTCGGAGQVQRVVRTAFGQMATATACARCDGTGVSVTDPCPTCQGEGRRVRKRTVTVEVPAGVDDGDRLRVSGEGEAGRLGAPAGDLFVQIQIQQHALYERDGRDLLGIVTLPMVQAVLGTSLEVPTVGGEDVTVEVPAGTQPGEVLTVRRAGLPRRGGGAPGDLKLTVRVGIPDDLDEEQRELVRQLAKLRGEDAPEAGGGLLRRLRDAFR